MIALKVYFIMLIIFGQIFVSLSWMAKATVQAALGPVALKRLAQDENSTAEEHKYAEIVLMICVLSIVLTAPIGAILISISGTRLLTKTKPLHVVEGINLRRN